MVTPILKPGRYCIQFAYHMYGNTMGKLDVYSSEGPNTARVKRWGKSGNQKNQWHQGSFNFTSLNTSIFVEFTFQATIGSGSSSDIALDDIIITSGLCSYSGSTSKPTTWSGMPRKLGKNFGFQLGHL